MKNISDAQQSSVIAVVAKIPVPEARKPFLVELEKRLSGKARVADEALLAAINSVLAAIPAPSYFGDAQGAYPPLTEDMTLKEAADLYLRMTREVGAWSWPPCPPLTPEQQKAKAESFAALSPEEQGAAYESTLPASYRAEQAKHRAEQARKEQEYAARPWPVDPRPPPQVPVIRGEVVSRDGEPEPPIVPLAERHGAKPTSIYGEALEYAKRHRFGVTKVFFR